MSKLCRAKNLTYRFFIKTVRSSSRVFASVLLFLSTIGAGNLAEALVVTNVNDSGAGSLREAIATGLPGEVITFDAGIDGQTIFVSSALAISGDLTIDGSTLDAGITINGGDVSGVFQINTGASATLDSLTITKGFSSGGGGIITSGSLTLRNSTLSFNNSSGNGGALYSNSGVSGTTIIENCTIVGNTAANAGGGIHNNFGFTQIVNSTITGNSAQANLGGGVGSYGAIDTQTEIYSSIISGNGSDVDLVSASFNSFVSLNYNLVGAGLALGAFTQAGDVTGVTNPLLSPLGNYGGPTQSMVPMVGSPALDAGSPIDPSTTDQRGAPRFANGAQDIGSVEKQVWVVTTIADEEIDPGTGLSLREAITESYGFDRIIFDPSIDGQTITLSGTVLNVDKSLFIDGSTLTEGITISGNNLSRVFYIGFEVSVNLESLTIVGGNAPSGGGVINSSSTVFISNCTFADNGALRGGAIYSNATGTNEMNVVNCTFTNNTASITGGALYNSFGKTIITNCTITGNNAPLNEGGGVVSYGASDTQTEVYSSIISGNVGGDTDLVSGTAVNSFTSFGYNLIGVGEVATGFTNTGDLIGITDPQLAPLANYGGSTPTMPPSVESSAIDSGSPINSGGTDQRGAPRFAFTAQDIGAVESLQIQPSPTQNEGSASLSTLSYSTISGATYEIFLGSGPESLVSLGTSTTSAFSLDPILSFNTDYYWQVVTVIGGKPYLSEILTFKTRASFSATGVNTIDDESDGTSIGGISLRDAIAEAVPGEVISFDSSIDGQTILLGGTQLSIAKDLTIDGSSLSDGITISGDGASRVLSISGGAEVVLDSLTITGGSDAGQGGGINNSSSKLTLRNSTLTGNSAPRGGGIFSATANGGPSLTTIENCTFTNNTAGTSGGAIHNNIGKTVILNSTISGNIAPASSAGGISSWGASDTQTEVYSSIISGNGDSDIEIVSSFVSNSFFSFGYNFIGVSPATSANAAFAEIGDVTGNVDPMLAPLGDFGGVTPTMTPMAGSPVIDAGDSIDPGGTDQRGAPRLAFGALDIGSVESLQQVSTPSSNTTNTSVSQDLEWSLVAGATYEVFLGTNPFGLLSQGVTVTNQFTLPSTLATDTDYYWQVATVIGGEVFLSEVFTFQTRPSFSVSGVNTIVDENDGFQVGGISLRDAIAEANVGEVINFDPSISGQTITLGGSELLINKSLTIDGSTIFGGITISGNNATRVFNLEASQEIVVLKALNITGGNADIGGGIRVQNTILSLQESTLYGNTATLAGGGIFYANDSMAVPSTIEKSTFTNNTTGGRGGAINCDIGHLQVFQSTISGNTAPVGEGGGIASFGASFAKTTIGLSVVSNNSGGDVDLGFDNQFNSFESGGLNVIGSGEAIGVFTSDDIVGVLDPILLPLANYGGPTLTMPPGIASPARDRLPISINPSLTDQRGAPRFATGATDAGSVEYQPVVVTTLVDETIFPGTGLSLREAVVTEFASTVTFDQGLDGQVLTLGGSELLISQSLIIDGSSLLNGITISGNNVSRVFVINAGAIVTLDSLTITEGTATIGGGIYSFDGAALTLRNSAVIGNAAQQGAGLYSYTSTGGPDLTTIVNCTFTGNTAFNSGGAIRNNNGTTVIAHTTITGNTAPAGEGSGIASYGDPLTDTRVFSSIISGNSSSDVDIVSFASNISFSSLGYNLIGSGDSLSAFDQTSDLTAITDPSLAPLANNGGGTQTMMLRPESAAIDAGPSMVTSPSTDQRGFERVLGSAVDIGAYEAAAGSYTLDGLTLHAKLDTALTVPGVVFEISTDPNFFATVSTLAGNGASGTTNGDRAIAQFSYPSGVAQDDNGNFYIADTANNRIQQITPSGEVSTIAGTGTFGFLNGSGQNAEFAYPTAVTVGPFGNLYVTDSFNNMIRKLQRPAFTGQPWAVTTLAGTGSPGFLDGQGSVAQFSLPQGIVADSIGNLFVADSLNHRIRKVSSSGVVSTYAGTGTQGSGNGFRTSAQFNAPVGVTLDHGPDPENPLDDLLVIADRDNNSLRRVASDGIVETLTSGLNAPVAVAVDGDNNYYVSNQDGHEVVKVTNDGSVTLSIAGSDSAISGFEDGNATLARFNTPGGLIMALNGDLILADSGNHSIRRIIVTPIQVEAQIGAIDGSETTISAILDVAGIGLNPNETYYVRWRSRADDSTQMLGQSFDLVDPPVVSTEPADPLTSTAATLNATVNPNNSPTTVLFKYSTFPDLSGSPRVSTFLDLPLDSPTGIAVGASGQLYIASKERHQILVVSSTGQLLTVYGTGVPGFANGDVSVAQFDNPSDVVVVDDFLFVVDSFNHRIRKIDLDTGLVSTIAGSGLAGFVDGAAGSARFLFPTGIAADSLGNLYVADTDNNQIRKISPLGDVSTPAGAAQFNAPQGVAVSSTDLIYVADTGNHKIRVISASNNVSTVAGTGVVGFLDGPGNQAEFAAPTGIVVDLDGLIYVTDRDNNRIRRIDAGNVVITLAGSGISGLKDSPSNALHPATVAEFDQPVGIDIDDTGRLYISEKGNKSIRELTRDPLPTLTVTPSFTGQVVQDAGVLIPEPLLPGETYYFCAEATNVRGTSTGQILSFTTPLPLVVIHDGDSIGGPQIFSEQTTINFGTTPFNVPVERTFTIENTGGFALNITGVAIESVASGGFSLSGNTGSYAIAPGAIETFSVTLESGVAGAYIDNIIISSDDLISPVFVFSVEGEALAPPALTAVDDSDVTETEATLSALVNPRGSETIVAFEYSKYADLDGVFEVQTLSGSTQGLALACGLDAQFDTPSGVAVDLLGNIYIADTGNHLIRKISSEGVCSVLAGTGDAGFANGLATDAEFDSPEGVAVDSAGNVYVADTLNHRIQLITPEGDVVTVAGFGGAAFTDGIGTAARFNQPTDVAVDQDGFIYVADSGNNRIRKIDLDNDVSTLAGPIGLSSPRGVAVDAAGNVYVADSLNGSIRKVTPAGVTTTLAGEGTFNNPTGVSLDAFGNVYVAERGGHLIIRINTNGSLTLIAGFSGSPGDTNGAGTESRFNLPTAIAVDPMGAIFVADQNNHRIRQINLAAITVMLDAGLNGEDPLPVSVDITGLEPDTTYYYRAIASNAGGIVYEGSLSPFASFKTALADGPPFVLWQINEFGDASDPLVSGPDADASGDGVVNILKYAFGLDPNVSSQDGLPITSQSSGTLMLSYTKLIGATDILYEAQTSTNLTTWATVGITETIVSDDGTVQQVLASVPISSGEVKFIRLEVTFL